MTKRLLIFYLSALISACWSSDDNINDNSGVSKCDIAKEIYENSGIQGTHESQVLLDSAINLCPDMTDAYHEISVPYLKRGDYFTWLVYLNKAIEKEPERFLGIRAWCRVKFLHDYNNSFDDFKKLESINRNSTIIVADNNIYSWMALCKAGLGEMETALMYIEKSINSAITEHGTEWVGMYDFFYRGNINIALGKFNDALKDFDNQLKLSPNLIDAYYYRAKTLINMSRKNEALTWLLRAKSLLKNEGYSINDPYVEMPWRIYEKDIDEAIFRLKRH
ncbi:hypothetical protein RYH73_14885 [Olivibacter sp. CPCC 100613]|uniref:tetratricopeptide repeat protein n=1 Tax=Olivibacter sp. CPCC 100613 TaxID=3079931 RepID=UPI002FF7F285